MDSTTEQILTGAQRDQFLADGFTRVDNLVTADELKWLETLYGKAFDPDYENDKLHRHNLGGTLNGRQVLPQVLGPSQAFPELVEGAFHQKLLAVAKGVLGDDARFRNDHMILKPAGYGAPTPWHQDQAYHEPDKLYHNVNIWIPLADANEANGCLHFVPGSQRYLVLPHERIETPGGHALAALGQDYWQANSVASPCPAGSATLHHSYVLHYAGANQTPHPRRAYIAVFVRDPEPLARPFVMSWRAS